MKKIPQTFFAAYCFGNSSERERITFVLVEKKFAALH